MSSNEFFKKSINFITGIFLSVVIISIIPNVVLSSKFFYDLHIGPLKLAERINLTEDQIKNNYSVLIDYLTDESISKLEFPDLVMSKEGEIHFEEVKDIFLSLKNFAKVFSILSLVFCIILMRNRWYDFLKFASILVLAPVVVLGVASLIDFDLLFTTFHRVAFNNSFWIFDEKIDPVIKILPEQYFLNCLIYILGLIFISSIALFLVYKMLKRHQD